MLCFKPFSTDYNKILHTSRQCNCHWRVQTFVVIGWICYEQEHYKVSLKFKFDRNIVSGTGAWCQMPAVSWLGCANRLWKGLPKWRRTASYRPITYVHPFRSTLERSGAHMYDLFTDEIVQNESANRVPAWCHSQTSLYVGRNNPTSPSLWFTCLLRVLDWYQRKFQKWLW